jgi:membrane protease YdiL (CAAX protease family)
MVAALLLAVVFYLRWQREVGLQPAASLRRWLLLWLPALFILGYLGFAVFLGFPPTSVVLLVLINTLIVGVEEELMVRGILLQGWLSRLNIWPAILLTSLLLGAVHAVNGFLTGDFTRFEEVHATVLTLLERGSEFAVVAARCRVELGQGAHNVRDTGPAASTRSAPVCSFRTRGSTLQSSGSPGTSPAAQSS